MGEHEELIWRLTSFEILHSSCRFFDMDGGRLFAHTHYPRDFCITVDLSITLFPSFRSFLVSFTPMKTIPRWLLNVA